jgi:hypothetical protein
MKTRVFTAPAIVAAIMILPAAAVFLSVKQLTDTLSGMSHAGGGIAAVGAALSQSFMIFVVAGGIAAVLLAINAVNEAMKNEPEPRGAAVAVTIAVAAIFFGHFPLRYFNDIAIVTFDLIRPDHPSTTISANDLASLMIRDGVWSLGATIALAILAGVALRLRRIVKPSRGIAIAITLIVLASVGYDTYTAWTWRQAFEHVAITGDYSRISR